MTPEQLDEIEKLAATWLGKEKDFYATGRDAAMHQFLIAMREHALPLVKAVRQAWQDREDYRNDAIAAEQECDRMLTSTALLTYLVEELVKAPRNGNRIEKLVEQSRTHLLRLREYEGSDE